MVPPISVLTLVTSALEGLAIPYVLVGSFASSMHGMYRATADIDILIDITAEQVHPLFASLQEAFYVDEHVMRNAVAHRRSFNAIHFDSVFKVDFFIAKDNEFAESQLNRRQLRKLSPDKAETVYVATAEDTILAKLRWYRAGNESSINQWNDVMGMVVTSRDSMDLNYLKLWAGKLGVDDLLQRAFNEGQTMGHED